MGMACSGEIFAACAKGDSGDGFGDEFAGPWPDDVHAEDAVGFFVSEDLYFTLRLSKPKSAAVGTERECAFLVGKFLFLQIIFGFSHGGDLRVCVNDAWDRVVI